jgi:Uma2 family endonuclease
MTLPVRSKREQSVRMSYAEFLRADFAERRHAEWVDGKVIFMPPISSENIDLQGLLATVLRAFVDAKGLWLLVTEPYVMKTGPTLPGRSPDIMFVAEKRRSKVKKMELQGPADLVIEIVSPSSRTTDRKDKFREYETGGVREYWIIDPIRKSADFFLLGPDHRYHPIPLDHDGIFRSVVLNGVWLRLQWLWPRLPPTTMILREWKLI